MANGLASRLAAGELLFGIQSFSRSESVVEVLGHSGFDWISIDMEHSGASWETVEHLIRSAQCGGATPLVRVASNTSQEIGRALDAGASGVIVPHVECGADVLRALEAARFPPEGVRSVCPFVRPAHYGVAENYFDNANEDALIMVLIESRAAIERLDEILSVDGVDLFWLGIGDLARSYDLPRGASLRHEPLRSIAQHMAARCLNVRKVPIASISPEFSVEYARFLTEMGFRAISWGTDLSLLRRQCTQVMHPRDSIAEAGP